MHRIDNVTAAASLPTPASAGTAGYFSNATPGSGTPTIVDNDWCNDIQEELISILTAASVAPSKTTHNQVLTALQGLFSAPAQGGFKNLKGVWVSNTTATWTADAVMLGNGSGLPFLLTAYSKTLNTALSGAGGLDTGTLAASTWYNVFAIYGTSGTSILMSLSATAPTMPSGYTYFARIGTVYTSASTKYLYGFVQAGRNTQYTGTPVVLISQAPAATNTVSVSSAVPPTAAMINVTVYNDPSSGTSNLTVGSNSSNNLVEVSGGSPALNIPCSILLESTNIYATYSTSGASTNNVSCVGYIDNF
jgi:hypothetical protein